jgi:predicted transcriptional regulator YheO
MDKKGVFLIKGAVEKVAEKLNISKVTVYSYLDAIKKNENE